MTGRKIAIVEVQETPKLEARIHKEPSAVDLSAVDLSAVGPSKVGLSKVGPRVLGQKRQVPNGAVPNGAARIAVDDLGEAQRAEKC